MLWTEFIRQSASRPEVEAKLSCAKLGHPPYVNDSQGGDGMVGGCWCGWQRLSTPLEPVPGSRSWDDYPEAVFDEH